MGKTIRRRADGARESALTQNAWFKMLTASQRYAHFVAQNAQFVLTRQHGAWRLSNMFILRRGMRNPCAPTFVPYFFPPRPTQAVEFSIAVPLANASTTVSCTAAAPRLDVHTDPSDDIAGKRGKQLIWNLGTQKGS